jgi:hypothetical protein
VPVVVVVTVVEPEYAAVIDAAHLQVDIRQAIGNNCIAIKPNLLLKKCALPPPLETVNFDLGSM